MVASLSSSKTAATVPLLVLLHPDWTIAMRNERNVTRKRKSANQKFHARSLT